MKLAGSGVRITGASAGIGAAPDAELRGRGARRFATTPEVCARAIARGVEHGNNEAAAPWSGQFPVWAARRRPGLAAWPLERMNRSLDGRR